MTLVVHFPLKFFLVKLRKCWGTRRPIAQLYKRLLEIDHQESIVHVQSRSKFSNDSFRSILSTIKPNFTADSFCLIRPGFGIHLHQIAENCIRGLPLIFSQELTGSFTNFSTVAINSTTLNIFIVNGIEQRTITVLFRDRLKLIKCMYMPFKDSFGELKYVLIPLLNHQ